MKHKGFTPLEISSYHKRTKFLTGFIPLEIPSINRMTKSLTGFTLTEVLIAMLLLSLATAGMFAVFIAGRRFTGGGGRKFEALNFARQTTEHLRDDVGVDDWNSPGVPLSLGNHSEPLPSGNLKDKWAGQRNYQVKWGSNNYGPDQRYKVVTVTVSWNEP